MRVGDKFFETFWATSFVGETHLPWPTELLFATHAGGGSIVKNIIPRLDLCHFKALLGGAWPEAA